VEWAAWTSKSRLTKAFSGASAPVGGAAWIFHAALLFLVDLWNCFVMTTVHILHENPEWIAPYREAFSLAGMETREIFMNGGVIDLASSPPEGVYWSRVSASALSRGHDLTAATAAATFDFLGLHGRRIINGLGALRLEMSKVAQHALLAAAGIDTPKTIAVIGTEGLEAAALNSEFARKPFVLKPNRGGKGLGVRLIEDLDDLRNKFSAIVEEPSADNVWLLQEYCPAPDQSITRLEFIGGKLHYAVRVQTGGDFELCPAEACALPGAPPMFQIGPVADLDLANRIGVFLKANEVEVAGVEYLRTSDGRKLVYDINTNTNYNREAEERAGVEPGPVALAKFIKTLA
jgi:glutathione synthase/RimK-type ligase-like ATP-grasp enzyme